MLWKPGLLNQRSERKQISRFFLHHWRKSQLCLLALAPHPSSMHLFSPLLPLPSKLIQGQLHSAKSSVWAFTFHLPAHPAPSMQHTNICAGSGKSFDQDYSLWVWYIPCSQQKPSLSHWLELALHVGWTLPNLLATDTILILEDSALKSRETISEKGIDQFDSENPALIRCLYESCA